MPKLWTETIEAHRRAVHEATLDTTAELVARHGVPSVTMKQIAEETGIGRATLYKYFGDIEAILTAWHERQINAHLEQLAAIRDRGGDALQRLHDVLHAYAQMSSTHHGSELAAALHQEPHAVRAQHRLKDFIRALVAHGAESGQLRTDVPPEELTIYCLQALAAAPSLSSKAAVRRLVAVTMDGMRGPAS